MERAEKQNRSLGRFSLTTKITLAFLVASLLPLVLISAYQLYIGANLLDDMAMLEIDLLASGLADNFDRLLIDSSIAVRQLSSDATVTQILAEPSEENSLWATERFQKILDTNPFYEYVYLMDADGLTLVSVQQDGLPSVAGKNFADRDYFINAMAGEPYIDALVGRVSKKLGFYFTAPVFAEDNGEVVGVVAIKVQGAAVEKMFLEFNEKAGQVSAFLIDYQGVMVIPPAHRPDWRLKGVVSLSAEDQAVAEARFVMDQPLQYIEIPELADLMEFDRGGVNYLDPRDDQGYIAGYQTTRNLNWVVGVVMAEDVFLEPISNLAWQSAGGALLMMLLVLVLAVVQARGIASPIMKLAAVAQDIEAHEPFEPRKIADVASLGDEVGYLARVFSDMVLALQARMAELKTINEIGRQIGSSVELSDTLSELIESLGEVIDFDAAEICLYDAKEKELELYVTGDEVFSADETVEKVTYSPKEDFFPLLFTHRDGLLIADVSASEAGQLSEKRTWALVEPKSYLGVALWHRQKVVGTIEMVSSRKDGFSEDNLRMLENISLQAAVAISNAQEVLDRERRLINMEIVVDDERVNEELEAVMQRDIVKAIKKKIKAGSGDK